MRTILAFMLAFRQEWRDESFRAIVSLALTLVFVGTIFYTLVEGWSPLDALYFSVVTMATVGYGDLSPKTDLGKAFTIVFILVGVGILVTFASRVVNAMVDQRAEHLREREQSREALSANKKSDERSK
jgi:voltage-gated potassium channel Kch